MARRERLALVEDGRAPEVVGASVRERGDSFARAPVPVNDVGSTPRARVAVDDIEGRIQQAFERKLLGPMSEIIEATTLLEHQVNVAQAEQLRAVKATASRQSDMLRDMLAFVQTTMWGRVRVKRRRVDLRLLCERVLDAIQTRHPDRPISLVSSPRVEGEWDPELMVTLLSNLALNAVQHGAANKVVRIALRAVDDAAVIEIASAGPALDEEIVGRLFEPFNCGHPGRSDGLEGLGLGLYLANEIALAHAGRIDAWSDPTAGTTFRVTMPRS